MNSHCSVPHLLFALVLCSADQVQQVQARPKSPLAAPVRTAFSEALSLFDILGTINVAWYGGCNLYEDIRNKLTKQVDAANEP